MKNPSVCFGREFKQKQFKPTTRVSVFSFPISVAFMPFLSNFHQRYQWTTHIERTVLCLFNKEQNLWLKITEWLNSHPETSPPGLSLQSVPSGPRSKPPASWPLPEIAQLFFTGMETQSCFFSPFFALHLCLPDRELHSNFHLSTAVSSSSIAKPAVPPWTTTPSGPAPPLTKSGLWHPS